MMKALVLIKFTSVATKDAYCHLKALKSVTETFLVYGRFDAVAIIQSKNLDEIRHVILSEIHPIPGVIETMPCIIVEEDTSSLSEQGLRPHPLGQTT